MKVTLLLTSLLVLVSCQTSLPANQSLAKILPSNSPQASSLPLTNNPFIEVDAQGSTTLVSNVLEKAVEAIPKSDLNAKESEGLLLMREEEKLARDVYTELAKRWPETPTFSNISRSESSHTESVRVLIERYQLSDPALSQAGKFTSSALQTLYEQLLNKGNASMIAALQVGLEIEELDIADLQKLAAQLDQDDIRLVYQELERGSRNHLRAFYKALLGAGGTYQAQHLSPENFEQIANSQMERGKN